MSQGSGRFAIAFGPRYVSKSGKETPGLGWYWSGCASRAKWGLEIGGLAATDIDNHTAFHLKAVQTLNSDDQNLSDWYAKVISERKDTLTSISKYLVADTWFSKKSFDESTIYAGEVYSKALRRNIMLVHVTYSKINGKDVRKLYFSTNISMDPNDVMLYYQSRFQIEFLYY